MSKIKVWHLLIVIVALTIMFTVEFMVAKSNILISGKSDTFEINKDDIGKYVNYNIDIPCTFINGTYEYSSNLNTIHIWNEKGEILIGEKKCNGYDILGDSGTDVQNKDRVYNIQEKIGSTYEIVSIREIETEENYITEVSYNKSNSSYALILLGKISDDSLISIIKEEEQ